MIQQPIQCGGEASPLPLHPLPYLNLIYPIRCPMLGVHFTPDYASVTNKLRLFVFREMAK